MHFEQRRNIKRRNLIYYLEAYCKVTRKLIGHVADLTSEGVLLVSEEEMKVGEELTLVIFLPDFVLGVKYLTLGVECVRCIEEKNKDYYNLGFKVTDLHPDDEDVIEQAIEEYGFKD